MTGFCQLESMLSPLPARTSRGTEDGGKGEHVTSLGETYSSQWPTGSEPQSKERKQKPSLVQSMFLCLSLCNDWMLNQECHPEKWLQPCLVCKQSLAAYDANGLGHAGLPCSASSRRTMAAQKLSLSQSVHFVCHVLLVCVVSIWPIWPGVSRPSPAAAKHPWSGLEPAMNTSA